MKKERESKAKRNERDKQQWYDDSQRLKRWGGGYGTCYMLLISDTSWYETRLRLRANLEEVHNNYATIETR